MIQNKERIEGYIQKNEFLKLVGFEIHTIEKGWVEGSLKFENKHKQQKGLLHGGVTATIADIVSGFAAYTYVNENEQVVTAELKISYLNPGVGDEIFAKGWVLKSGRRMNFCEAEVYCIQNSKENSDGQSQQHYGYYSYQRSYPMKKKPSELLNNYLKFLPSEGQSELFEKTDNFLLGSAEKNVMLIKGYAGTGKTTVLGAIVNILRYFDYKFVLLAPTGRAAKVMANYSEKKAYTIHKWIYKLTVDPDTGRVKFKKQKNYYKRAVFVVDEVSMITNETGYRKKGLLKDLIDHVFEKPENGNKLLLVGDTAQLPPVGYLQSPALDHELLQHEFGLEVIMGELNEVMRQGKDSGVLLNATEVRRLIEQNGSDLKIRTNGLHDVYRLGNQKMEDGIRYAYDKYGQENTIIICRSNRAANQYNQFIRRQIFYYEDEIEAGDVLMIAKNNYFWLEEDHPAGFLANGEFAEVTRVIDLEEKYGLRFAKLGLKLVDYPDTEAFEANVILDSIHTNAPALSLEENDKLFKDIASQYDESDWKNLKNDPYLNALQIKFSYALTCHKSQGGQWPVVFIDQGFIPGNEINEDFLRWLYTAMTRATQELYFVNFNNNFF